jgi:hypothetical protein
VIAFASLGKASQRLQHLAINTSTAHARKIYNKYIGGSISGEIPFEPQDWHGPAIFMPLSARRTVFSRCSVENGKSPSECIDSGFSGFDGDSGISSAIIDRETQK